MAESNRGRTALITGASGGIGEELARVFAANGFDLVLAARTEAKLRALGDELADRHGIRATALAADLADPAAPAALVARVTELGLTIDALVNNAGFAAYGEFTEDRPGLATIVLRIKSWRRADKGGGETVSCGAWLATITARGSPHGHQDTVLSGDGQGVDGGVAAGAAARRPAGAPARHRAAAAGRAAARRRVAARVGMGVSTVYGWLHAFLAERCASLVYRTSPGRPAKLTPTQKQRLRALVAAGPEAAGYATGCWNSAMVAGSDRAGVRRAVQRPVRGGVAAPPGLLLPEGALRLRPPRREARRQHWRTVAWPAILRAARRQGALLLFGDEASFAQWGSLGYTWALRGQQPLVQTTGKRKGYKVFGLIDYFSGRLFSHGHDGRFTAESYCAFLTSVLAATTGRSCWCRTGRALPHRPGHPGLLRRPRRPPDGPPAAGLLARLQPDRAPVAQHQAPHTHNRYFPAFATLTEAVETALAHFRATRPRSSN